MRKYHVSVLIHNTSVSTVPAIFAVLRDYQGFQNPQGSGVGYMRVRVRVGISDPHKTLTLLRGQGYVYGGKFLHILHVFT